MDVKEAGKQKDCWQTGRLLTVSEVAELLNIHPKTVKNWANRGMLPCYRLATGRRDRRFKLEDAMGLLQTHVSRSKAGQLKRTPEESEEVPRFRLPTID
jgi:excisionase family DNA binding protein